MTEPKPMLSVQDALAILLAAARSNPITETETIPTLGANGRTLAAVQTSQINVPPMNNSQMDGYAVRSVYCASGEATLKVTQRIAAGQVAQALQPGTAARIFTGAMMPSGADSVVMQEQVTTELREDGGFVTIKHVPKPGDWVRKAGEDIQAGSTILAAGTRLRGQELGLAASVGLANLPVLRKPRIAVFFTGDELTMPGEPLKPGAIYNSNRFTLRGLLENLRCDITDYGIVPDSLEATRATLRKAAEQHDLIITSGGVSVGEEDHIKPAVEAEGHLNMWQIAVKPGKPLAFGEVKRGAQNGTAFFLGLPGNPVAGFVTFLLFVRPFILTMQGVANIAPQSFKLRADFEWPKADKRNEFLRVKINADGGLDLYNNQSSGVLTSTVWGDGLVDNQPGQTIAKGDMVKFIPFSGVMA